jgi:hypothetical protein
MNALRAKNALRTKRAQTARNRASGVAKARTARKAKAPKSKGISFAKSVTRSETNGNITAACSVLVHAIAIGLVYPMHAGFNFPVGDAIAANNIPHTIQRYDRQLMCMLLRVHVLGKEWVKQILCKEGSDIEALEHLQSMLVDEKNIHAKGTLLYEQLLHATTHLYDGQVCWI